jgi:hypothetical protein
MNFTFTWILDKFGLQPKFEVTPVAKKATTVAKKKPAAKKVVAKKTVRKKA